MNIKNEQAQKVIRNAKKIIFHIFSAAIISETVFSYYGCTE